MPFLHSVTFNICKDNGKAADELVEVLKAKGFGAERLEVPKEGLDHAEAMGQKSPPAALSHDAPSDVVVPLMIKVEEANT